MNASGIPVAISVTTMNPQLRFACRGDCSPCDPLLSLRALPPTRIAAVSYDGVVPMCTFDPYTRPGVDVWLMYRMRGMLTAPIGVVAVRRLHRLDAKGHRHHARNVLIGKHERHRASSSQNDAAPHPITRKDSPPPLTAQSR